MPTKVLFNRQFDARPDRIDFRDLSYRPPLVSLPNDYPGATRIKEFFPVYGKQHMVLNQGEEGACTGFGLAAVINYLRWEAPIHETGRPRSKPPGKVSPRMLYQNARLYDEWKGEDYEGSSCRGAMKGLHKHGVATEDFWPYLEKEGSPGLSRDGWDEDAAQCPLGAYYRIDERSLLDMQAAINEVHAIYVSANVHNGWNLDTSSSLDGAKIRPKRKNEKLGGHAFAIVGYRPDGFIVQNSWGPDWGFHGFAVLPYDEWTAHGEDAWVLALGAPMMSARSPTARTEMALQDRSSIQARFRADAAAADGAAAIGPWMNGEEFDHSVFIGHDGRAERELVAATDSADAVRRVIEVGVAKAIKSGVGKIAVFAHGGLNKRDAGLKRARILGPWFKANGIHPIFVIWQTGFFESAGDIIQMQIDKLGPAAEARPVEGWIVDTLTEAKDRGFEFTARNIGVKAIWENMKSRAMQASEEKGGLALAAADLRAAFAAAGAAPEIHLLGHSAGAIMLGHFLGALGTKQLSAASIHLWAPACTAGFANQTYGKAFKDGVAKPATTYFGILSDKNEASDPCVPIAYSKSLLYLVSRSLEQTHKTPVIGMEKSWKATWPPKNDDFFNADLWKDMVAWNNAATGVTIDPPITSQTVPTSRHGKDVKSIPANHGSFDNDLDVVNLAIARMLKLKQPRVPITDLVGF